MHFINLEITITIHLHLVMYSNEPYEYTLNWPLRHIFMNTENHFLIEPSKCSYMYVSQTIMTTIDFNESTN